jgi:ATP-dependent RNA helicase RhlE
MHSDLDQSQRDQTMHEFRSERIDILVATDIVARGIDIDDISLIVNFEVPRDVEDYVHRIGRTARAGDSGTAITLVSPQEQHRFLRIEKFLHKDIDKIPVPAELGSAPEYRPQKERKSKKSSRSQQKKRSNNVSHRKRTSVSKNVSTIKKRTPRRKSKSRSEKDQTDR